MSPKADAVFAAALELPEEERLELADRLLETLPPERQAEVEKVWAEEAERRLRDLREGRASTRPWSEVRDSLLNRVKS